MKRNIFDALMKIKTEILDSLQSLPHQIQSSEIEKKEEPLLIIHEPETIPIATEIILHKITSAIEKQPIVISETRYFEIIDEGPPRKIAYTISGDVEGQNVLLCLPGLLETKDSFSIVHAYFLKFENCKVISIDFSGRGESDYIDGYGAYKMSLYLSDISQLIRELILNDKKSNMKLTILGTSMGGVLAMYLTKIFGKLIREIILNDIALTVNWTSLYGLYKSMKNNIGFKEVRDLAKDLSVDERAISDVQLPGHFDLSYRADVWGMNFHEALEDYKGKVALIFGGKSKICTKQRVEEARSFIPHLHTLEVTDAGHPAPYSLLVCDFIQQEMGV